MSSSLRVYRRITRGPLSRRCLPFGSHSSLLWPAPHPSSSLALQIVYLAVLADQLRWDRTVARIDPSEDAPPRAR